MKAKVKETGEIVDVYHEPQHGQITNIYKESVFVNGRIWTEDELEFIELKEVNLVLKQRKANKVMTQEDKDTLDSYVSASTEFNVLIEQGWAKPRGYNLQTIDEVGFSTPFNEGI